MPALHISVTARQYIDCCMVKNQWIILQCRGGMELRNFWVKKSGHATINLSNNHKNAPSACRPFIFQSRLDNILIAAWSKNQWIILQCRGGMELRNFWVKKSGHATIKQPQTTAIIIKTPPLHAGPSYFSHS
jgi:hypothetical protein